MRGWAARRSGLKKSHEPELRLCSPSPQPSGFPSPPRVSFPKGDERFALRGPPGEGGEPAQRFNALVFAAGIPAPKAERGKRQWFFDNRMVWCQWSVVSWVERTVRICPLMPAYARISRGGGGAEDYVRTRPGGLPPPCTAFYRLLPAF